MGVKGTSVAAHYLRVSFGDGEVDGDFDIERRGVAVGGGAGPDHEVGGKAAGGVFGSVVRVVGVEIATDDEIVEDRGLGGVESVADVVLHV